MRISDWSSDVCSSDLVVTCRLENDTTVEEINAAFKVASETNLKGILEYTEDPIVSVDILGNPHSCIFDAQLTSIVGDMVKVVGWYDNESGYSRSEEHTSELQSLMRISYAVFCLKK